ncbi:MAG: hypothetical protein NVSMB9_32740 [Isosphaeraceae bacterium]
MNANRRNLRKRPLQVESLESLTLLSGFAARAGIHPPAIVMEASAPQAIRAINLVATARGFYSSERKNPDTGTSYGLFAFGRAVGFGPLFIGGNLRTPGFIQQGHVTGTIHVSSFRGTVDLDVTGPQVPGFSQLPSTLTFKASHGTGRFVGASGTGTIDVTLRPANVSPNSRGFEGRGRISLVVHYNQSSV